MKMQIKRVALLKSATFGVILVDGLPFAMTVEPPWLDNKPRVSCIPAGNYTAARCRTLAHYGYADSPRFGDTFEILNVPGRSRILFHKGNTSADTLGCVILGEKFEPISGKPAVLESAAAFAEFKRITAVLSTFAVEIIDC